MLNSSESQGKLAAKTFTDFFANPWGRPFYLFSLPQKPNILVYLYFNSGALA